MLTTFSKVPLPNKREKRTKGRCISHDGKWPPADLNDAEGKAFGNLTTPNYPRGPGCHRSTQPATLLVPRTLAGGCPVRRPLLHKAAGTAACRGPCRSTGSWKLEKILLFLRPCPVPSTSPVVITQHRAIKAVGRRRGLAQAENSVFSPRMDGSPSIITKNEHRLIKRDIHTLKTKKRKVFVNTSL